MKSILSWTFMVVIIVTALFGGVAVFWMFRGGHAESFSEQELNPAAVSQEVPVPSAEPASSVDDLRATLPPPPPPPSMDRMKREGCVADGLLNGDFPGDGRTFSLINRSKCYFLSRAIETWLSPPDWDTIDENRAKLRDGFLPGMFIAEAIGTGARYFYPDGDRDFDFSEMCRPGSRNFWGERTCKPSFSSEEYRKYLRFITRQAMDRNIQVFLFGQVYLQDANDLSQTFIPGIISDMREYADLRGMKIFVGAQTNDISDPKYLRLFDFIEGGVGIDETGNMENGPCFSRWWKKEGDWCWGLLWNDRFSRNAKNVFLHLDWSGKIGDDMSVFTRMDAKTRADTLRRLYGYFTGKNMGFLLPYLTRLAVDNGGCFGPSKHFYTPDKRYGCNDEPTMDALLSSGT